MDIHEKFKKDRIYVNTGSFELTGSYNSARIAKELFLIESPNATFAIFDSKSASVGELLQIYRLIDLEKASYDFIKIIEIMLEYIK